MVKLGIEEWWIYNVGGQGTSWKVEWGKEGKGSTEGTMDLERLERCYMM